MLVGMLPLTTVILQAVWKQRCVVVANSSSSPKPRWVGTWQRFPFHGRKALGCEAGRRCSC